MTTLTNRPGTALLVIDVQRGVLANAHQRDAVVANIAGLVAAARAADTPVVWVQHSSEELPIGSDAWRLVDECSVADGEALVPKLFGDAFEDTDLEQVLAERRVGTLVVAGAQTDACIRATIHGAQVRGYDVRLVGDAHTTQDLTEWGAPPPGQVIAHTNLYWSFQAAPGRTAEVLETADVRFSPAS